MHGAGPFPQNDGWLIPSVSQPCRHLLAQVSRGMVPRGWMVAVSGAGSQPKCSFIPAFSRLDDLHLQ